jgi:glycosyltransferase involved in cell wall biosynthesis
MVNSRPTPTRIRSRQMFDFKNSVFGSGQSAKQPPQIPITSKVIFVSDMFQLDYVGGAELTSQALIDSSPYEVFNLHSRDVTMELLQAGAERFWIFGNFAELNIQLIPTIIGNLKYEILEYDYKYCNVRSPEKHNWSKGHPCDCHNMPHGKMISAFFHRSMKNWWMSQKQMNRYTDMFPFLLGDKNHVLSSVFSQTTLSTIKNLRQHVQDSNVVRKDWIVLGSNSWVKGYEAAEKWCQENNKSYEVVWNVPYDKLLEKLSCAEGFVYLPVGGDTCPRMVIEAKLLGCKLHLNENVQHKDESWFKTDDIKSIEDHLSTSTKTFWDETRKLIEYKPGISGYTTTYNCIQQEYPFEQCIESMIAFCNEVCVVDGGSTDGTISRLVKIAWPDMDLRWCDEIAANPSLITDLTGSFPNGLGQVEPRIKIKVIPRDWNHPRFAVFDGMQKAAARAMCTQEYCWQMDSDEIVHESDGPLVEKLCRTMIPNVHVMSLPVIEYWGSSKKVRADIQPWKWRLSRNHPDVTHGIPARLRQVDSDGNTYALPGTDGCDMISKETGEDLQNMSFYSPDVENIRRAAMLGDPNALKEYERWFNAVVNQLPCVFHYSWFDLPRKIRLYKNYWTKHWNSLMAKNADDTAENNMMFDVPWSDVTVQMIESRARELNGIGGWIWHQKWNGQKTPHITCFRTQPKIML